MDIKNDEKIKLLTSIKSFARNNFSTSEIIAVLTKIVSYIENNSFKNFGSINDGATVIMDCKNITQSKFIFKTAQSTPTINISRLGEILNIVVKPATTTTVTLSGTGLKFIDLDNIASAAATIDLTCDNTYNEISLNDSGDTDSGDRIILVVKK